VQKLRNADFAFYCHVNQPPEIGYEAALEDLDRVVSQDPSLNQYLNKPYHDDILPDYGSVPRLNSYKSWANDENGIQKIDKQSSLRSALRAELDTLKSFGFNGTLSSQTALLERFRSRD
jgi:hypothetical protein